LPVKRSHLRNAAVSGIVGNRVAPTDFRTQYGDAAIPHIRVVLFLFICLHRIFWFSAADIKLTVQQF